MKNQPITKLNIHDNEPERAEFLESVLTGLQKDKKELPCKYLYDERGSILFDKICDLDEYYPTRTELRIMQDNIDEIVNKIGQNIVLIEYGSGSSLKTRVLLDALKGISSYVPIDISKDHLYNTASDISKIYPNLKIHPVCVDYTKSFSLPEGIERNVPHVVYFPGSTIGNFNPDEAREFLRDIYALIQNNGSLLLGVDLIKDPAILHNAYNDKEGITASFNCNILTRINRELGGNFVPTNFRHYAYYNPDPGRVEMHIISLTDQNVRLNGKTISFSEGESIHTENSYKYSLRGFSQLSKEAGFDVEHVWVDDNQLFSVQLLKPIAK